MVVHVSGEYTSLFAITRGWILLGNEIASAQAQGQATPLLPIFPFHCCRYEARGRARAGGDGRDDAAWVERGWRAAALAAAAMAMAKGRMIKRTDKSFELRERRKEIGGDLAHQTMRERDQFQTHTLALAATLREEERA